MNLSTYLVTFQPMSPFKDSHLPLIALAVSELNSNVFRISNAGFLVITKQENPS